MKSLLIIFTLFLFYFNGKSQDTIRYAVNGTYGTHLLAAKDSISINVLSKEKNLTYQVVDIKLSFKKYDMKMLKTIKDTVITFSNMFSKNPSAVFKPGNFPFFKEAESLTITAGDIFKKNKQGKTETASVVFGRESEFQLIK